MTRSAKILICGGIALAAFGMLYGLHYAVFIEHQTLDRMGGALADGFVHTAQRRMPEARAAIDAYGWTKYNYVRQVDVHSHWIGLAMLLLIVGAGFDRIDFDEKRRHLVAWSLVAGSVVFPLGVILQTIERGVIAQAVAALGALMVIIALGAIALGFARAERN